MSDHIRIVCEVCGAAGRREVFILEDLKDTNIVQFMGACFEEGSAMLVTEFMAGGNLFDAIGNDRSGKLGWYQRCAHPFLSLQCPSSLHGTGDEGACTY